MMRHRTKKRLGAVMAGAGLLCLITAALLYLDRPSDGPPEALPVAWLDAGPDRVVGDEIVVMIGTEPAANGEAVVVLRSAMAGHEFVVDVRDGDGRLVVPDEIALRSGVLEVRSGNQVDTVRIEPGEAAPPARALVGPRTIVADNTDFTLAVVIAQDAHGNLAADGTAVDFFGTQPGDRQTTRSSQSSLGLAWTIFPSGQTAGPGYLQASVRGEFGPRVRIDEVPGRAVDVAVTIPDGLPTADGRSLVQLDSELLVDRFDNVVPDGVIGSFVITTSLGVDTIPATVQNGRLRAWWPAPARATIARVRAVVNGVESNPVELTFETAVAELPIATSVVDGQTIVEVGPVRGPDGAFVPDGTVVLVNDTQTALREGRAAATLDRVESAVTVHILGVEARAEVPA